MTTAITVNLPVRDVQKSVRFFTSLGFSVDPQFADHSDMECLVIAEGISVMLLSNARFTGVTRKDLVDATRSAEAIVQLRVHSRQRVDALVERALAGGALIHHEPNDQEHLYGRSFQDLDGHLWDVFCLASREGPA
jgi:predicted lactoylglutathione lyase